MIPPAAGERPPVPKWSACGRSVRGEAHCANDVPNEDAIAFVPHAGRSDAVIVAVSDGHGSPTCFRSDAGARFATEAGIATLAALARTTNSEGSLPRFDASVRQRLLDAWRQRVSADLRRAPFTDAELHALDARGRTAHSAVLSNPFVAYGTTLLAVATTEDFAAYLQIGDGDLLVRSLEGRTRRIFERDERLAATETLSLCLPDAWREIRTFVEPHDGAPPALILASTDGYANSFRTDADFLRIAEDYERLIVSDGFEAVAGSLERHLHDTSVAGSGDDITLGIIALSNRSCVAPRMPPDATPRHALGRAT